MAANDTLGLNIEFPIYNADGTSFQGLVLKKSTYDSIVMSLGDKVTGDVYYKDNTLAVSMQEYIVLDGVKYVLVTPPTVVREGTVSDNGQLNGMTKYSFVFYHPMYMLGNFPFADVAVSSAETKCLSESKKFTWVGYPDDFIAKMNKNLDGTEWIVEKSNRFPAYLDEQLSGVLPFDGNTIADACKTFYETWGAPYVVAKVESTETAYASGKRFKVVFGLPSNEIYADAEHEQLGEPFVFQFGKGVGLKNNSRTPRNNKIVTRIAGYGSENNIPYGYPQIPWYGDSRWDYTEYEGDTIVYDADGHVTNTPKSTAYPLYMGIVGGAYVKLIQHPFTRKNLMPSIYGQTLFNKVSPYLSDGTANPNYNPNTTLIDYYDAIATQEYPYPNPIVANAPSYESHEFEDVKPELGQNIAIVDAYPINKDLTPASSWDDSIDDDGNYVQSYFKMQLPVLSFDIYACAAITQEMQINMRSGACLGCTFTVQVDWDDYKANFYDADGNFAPTGSQRDYTKYPDSSQEQITVVLQKDTATFGTIMPNAYQYPVADDTFVVLGISLPLSYITNAETRLDAEMKSYMLENNVHYFDYPLKFDEAFLRNHTYILSQIKPNAVIRFKYGNDTLQLFVKQLTVKYGDNPLPQYDITLTDNVEVVLNQIGRVADDVEKLGAIIAAVRQNYNRSVWAELEKKLSKTQDDTAAGYIRMLKGLQVGSQFVPDILGQGGVFRMGADGKVELVTDRLYARVSAYFDNVEIRDYRHSGGNRIASQAQGFTCSRVEWIKVVSGNETVLEQNQENLSDVDFFRCYWRIDDGEKKTDNQFIIGDLAFCESANVDNDTLTTKRYWRVVVGRNSGNTTTADGEAWVDLSNAHNANGTPKMTTITYQGQGGVTQTMQVLSFETGSGIPEPKDDICQLGDVRDTTRQGAIIEYVTGVDAPSYQIFQGIGEDATNPYSLTNKNQITIGYNSATGHADLKVYGDAYIGDPNGSTFIEYKQDDGTQQHLPVLNIKAKIQTLPNSTYEGKTASQFVQDNQLKYDTDIQNLTNITNDLQSQIDGEIVSWFYEGTPTLDNAPAVDWDTDTLKERHLGDMYYDVGTGVTSGFAYRFIKSEQGVYDWQYIDDTAITLALAKAAEALGLAGSKAKTYTTANNVLPSAPYNVGDLWLNATGTWGSGANAVTWENEILKCINACPAGGTPDISDWAKASKYTDDSAFNGYINAFLNGSGASGDSATAAAIQKAIASALGSGTVVDGGLLLTSLIGMRKYKGSGSRTDVANYDTWAGISGQYDANVFGGGIAAWYGGGMLDKETLGEQISQGWSTLRWAKSLDRFDGSGYRADGNISWTKDGALTIKNITTLSDSNNKNLLNELATFNSAFTFATTGEGSTTVLSITPQQPFTELYIGTSKVDANIAATRGWVNSNFVTKTWFDNLFRLYNGTTKIEVNGTIPSSDNLNIEAMFGFWTKKYISALGQGDDGSTSYTTLAQLNDVTLTNPTANQILVYDGTHWRNQNQQSVYELPTASADTLGGVKVGTTLSISSGVLNLATTSVTAGTYRSVSVDAYGRVTGGTNPTTLSGYGITDAKIANGVITLGANTITPLTSHQTLYTLSVYGGTTKVLDFKPNANASLYIKAGGDISLTNDTTNKYITLSYSHPTNGANTTIAAANGKVLSAITVNNLGHVTSVSSKTLAAADIPDLGGTYLKLSGGTIGCDNINSLKILRKDTTNPSAISFYNYSSGTTQSALGAIGFDANGTLRRWASDLSTKYTIVDGGNYSRVMNIVSGAYQYTESNPYTHTSASKDGFYYLNAMSFYCVAGEKYTISCETDGNWSYHETDGKDPSLRLCSVWVVNEAQTYHYCCFTTVPNVWTCPTTGNYKFRTNTYSNGTDNLTVHFWNFKVERGQFATDWNINVADPWVSALKLTTARTLWGQSFNGTENVSGFMTGWSGAADNITDNWSDGTNVHPWYGYDRRSANTGVYSTTISDYYGLTLKTASGNLSMTDMGNVGINTTNPSGKLHVYLANNNATTKQAPALKVDGKIDIYDNVTGGGTNNSLLNILFDGGHEYGTVVKIHSYGNDAPTIRFSHSNSVDDINNQVNTAWSVGMSYNSAYGFCVVKNRGISGWGTEVVTINSNGYVGIGTTSPQRELHVEGTGRFSNYIEFLNAAGTARAGWVGRGSSLDNVIGLHADLDALKLYGNSTLVMTLSASSNVGLASVNGNITTDNTNGRYVQIGAIRLVYDSTNNAIKVIKSDGTNANLYATGGVSALGAGQESGGGGGGNYLPLAGGVMSGSIKMTSATGVFGGLCKHSDISSAGNPNTLWLYNANELSIYGAGINFENGINCTSPDITFDSSNIRWLHSLGTQKLMLSYYASNNMLFGSAFYVSNNGATYWQSGRFDGESTSGYPLILNVAGGGVCVHTTGSNTYALEVGGSIGANSYNNRSDMRQKDLQEYKNVDINTIANAPSFTYYWKNKKIDTDLHIGTSAQYWQSVLPEIVTVANDNMHTLSMQYGVAALISAISIAKKVVKHEEKIALLEKRVSALEKENGEQEQLINSLQEELSKFKAA